MPTVVIPFAGVAGKTRLHESPSARRALSLAMFADVAVACAAIGTTRVVTADSQAASIARVLGVRAVVDPGGGQGAAVAKALEDVGPQAILIVNADLPCVVPADLRALLGATPPGGAALVEAPDGTTNALSLPGPDLFAPLYGRDSAERFRAHIRTLGVHVVTVAAPNLVDDVDTLGDLERLQPRCGPRTQECLASLPVEALR